MVRVSAGRIVAEMSHAFDGSCAYREVIMASVLLFYPEELEENLWWPIPPFSVKTHTWVGRRNISRRNGSCRAQSETDYGLRIGYITYVYVEWKRRGLALRMKLARLRRP